MRDLRDTHERQGAAVRAVEGELQRLEQRVAELVNAVYGLTVEDMGLMWRTAPPRMPAGQPV